MAETYQPPWKALQPPWKASQDYEDLVRAVTRHFDFLYSMLHLVREDAAEYQKDKGPGHVADFMSLPDDVDPNVAYATMRAMLGADQISTYIREMCLCRVVDAFDYYLCCVAEGLYRLNPASLDSKTQPTSVPFGKLLEKGISIEAIIAERIDKKVLEFGYVSLPDKMEMLRKLGLTVALPEDKRELIMGCVQMRHAIVHNQSRATILYIQVTRRADIKVGDPLVISKGDVIRLIHAVKEVAEAIDREFQQAPRRA